MHPCAMQSALERPDLATWEIPAFPPWLDLPPDYMVQDWISWQKGKLVAQKLRAAPALLDLAKQRLEERRDRRGLHMAEEEWLELLNSNTLDAIATIMETPDHEGQRLRSSTPFTRSPFVEPQELEAILERAYLG